VRPLLPRLLIALSLAAAAPAGATAIVNGSFESNVIATDSYCITFASPLCGAVTGWSGDFYVVNGAPQAITPLVPIPDGNQLAMLQASTSFQQSVTIDTAGTYQLTWFDAGRNSFIGASGNEPYQVVFDGNIVGSFATTTGSPWTQRSAVFSSAAGTFTLSIEGLKPFGQGDDAALLDAFAIAPYVAPEPSTLALEACTLLCLPAFRRAASRRR